MTRRPLFDRRGASALEFALILPILLALIVGIIDFGWYFQANGQVVAAVREGTRLGVTYPSDEAPAQAITRIRAVLTGYGFNGAAAVITTAPVGATPNEMLSVTVSLPFDPLVGMVAVAMPTNLTASMTMLLEQQDE